MISMFIISLGLLVSFYYLCVLGFLVKVLGLILFSFIFYFGMGVM